MKKSVVLPLFLAALGSAAFAAEVKFQSGFEKGLEGWELPKSRAEVGVSATAASGKQAAEIRFDPAGKPEKRHSGVLWSKKIPVTRGIYRVTGKIQLAEGYGATVGIMPNTASSATTAVISAVLLRQRMRGSMSISRGPLFRMKPATRW